MCGSILIPKAQVFLSLLSSVTCQLIVELRKNEFERLLEYIHARVGKNFILHILD